MFVVTLRKRTLNSSKNQFYSSAAATFTKSFNGTPPYWSCWFKSQTLGLKCCGKNAHEQEWQSFLSPSHLILRHRKYYIKKPRHERNKKEDWKGLSKYIGHRVELLNPMVTWNHSQKTRCPVFFVVWKNWNWLFMFEEKKFKPFFIILFSSFCPFYFVCLNRSLMLKRKLL